MNQVLGPLDLHGDLEEASIFGLYQPWPFVAIRGVNQWMGGLSLCVSFSHTPFPTSVSSSSSLSLSVIFPLTNA